MKDKSKLCIVTQARLNSQRLPRKMVKPIWGDDSLFELTCRKLEILLAEYQYDTLISICQTEKELVDIAKRYNSEIYYRSEESANSDTGLNKIYEWHQYLQDKGYEYVVLVNACMPFLSAFAIEYFCYQYLTSEKEGAFSVFPKQNYFWNTEGTLLNKWPEGQDLMNTKAVETTYEAAHALYGSRLDAIGQGYWMAKMPEEAPELIQVSEFECLDVDKAWQFNMCKAIIDGGFLQRPMESK